MNGQIGFGLVVCVVLFFYFLMKGRTRDVVSIVAVVIGCIAIMFVVANWDNITHLSLSVIPSSHATSASTPAPTSTPVVTPTSVPHPTPTAVQTAPTSSPAVSSQSAGDGTGFDVGVGVFFLLAILFFMYHLLRAKVRMQARRPVQPAPEDDRVPVEIDR